MFKLPKQVCWIVSVIIVFAICTPITASLAGVLLISQNVNSLITVLLGIIAGIGINYYLPIVHNSFNNIFNLLQK